MPTRIPPSSAHQSQRLAYHPSGWLLDNIERSHKLASGLLRVSINGRTRAAMAPRRMRAIALGLKVASQSTKAVAIPANTRVTGDVRGELKAIMKTREIRAHVPPNTIGFSRLAGRK